MGTNNFYTRNASKYFVVLTNYEEDILDENNEPTGETQTVSCDEYDRDDLTNLLREKLADIKDCKEDDYFDRQSQYDLKSYPSIYVTSVTKDFTIVTDSGIGITITIFIDIFIRSAYYEGATLDWECRVEIDSTDPDIEDQFREFIDEKVKPIKSKLIEDIEKVFGEISTSYIKTAQFSNGEAIYEKVKTKDDE